MKKAIASPLQKTMSSSEQVIQHLGVAGYMGAGKSLCCAYLKQRGYSIINADEEAKLLMQSDPKIKTGLVSAFGNVILNNGTVLFSVLGELAFSSRDHLSLLNSIVHGKLLAHLEIKLKTSDCPCVLDAALIPLWKTESWFEKCLWVQADASLRIKRLLTRTTMTKEHIGCRMALQESMMPLPNQAHWTILENNETPEQLIRLIDKVLKE
jgi:dephospho-CoA kinase